MYDLKLHVKLGVLKLIIAFLIRGGAVKKSICAYHECGFGVQAEQVPSLTTFESLVFVS